MYLLVYQQIGFNTTGSRILGVEKQTCYLHNFHHYLSKHDLILMLHIECKQLGTVKIRCWPRSEVGDVQAVACSLSSQCLVQLHRLVPLLYAIFQTDPMSTKAENDSCRCVEEWLWWKLIWLSDALHFTRLLVIHLLNVLNFRVQLSQMFSMQLQ